jgi:hypothetical protein
MTNELKPCPRCGGEAYKDMITDTVTLCDKTPFALMRYFFIACKKCKLRTPSFTADNVTPHVLEAINKFWNEKRTDNPDDFFGLCPGELEQVLLSLKNEKKEETPIISEAEKDVLYDSLKDCPFCDGEAEFTTNMQVQCSDCKALVENIDKWNERVPGYEEGWNEALEEIENDIWRAKCK